MKQYSMAEYEVLRLATNMLGQKSFQFLARQVEIRRRIQRTLEFLIRSKGRLSIYADSLDYVDFLLALFGRKCILKRIGV